MGELVKRLVYQNIHTSRTVIVIKRDKGMVQVEYTASGQKSWFVDADFSRLFNLI